MTPTTPTVSFSTKLSALLAAGLVFGACVSPIKADGKRSAMGPMSPPKPKGAAAAPSASSAVTTPGPPCDFYVGQEGDDDEEGSEIDYPMQTLTCALSPNCNNGLQKGSVICMLPGEYEVYDRIRPGCSFEVTLAAYQIGTVILDGMEQGNLIGVGRTPMNFYGIKFTGARGTTGACIYGEARMTFTDCIFEDNESEVDAAAVMVMRTASFTRCQFYNNRAKYAGAVRVSDIGAAEFTDCTFANNYASGKGGAIVTQVENPTKNAVVLHNTLFCFNDSPEGKHVYNFRSTTHECTDCKYNTRECCSNNGRVVKNACMCDEGWSGVTCADAGGTEIEGAKKDEL